MLLEDEGLVSWDAEADPKARMPVCLERWAWTGETLELQFQWPDTSGHLGRPTPHLTRGGMLIPTIGLMVAIVGIVVCLYVIWRMTGDEGKGNVFRAGLAAVTVMVAMVGILALAFLAWSLIVASFDSTTLNEFR